MNALPNPFLNSMVVPSAMDESRCVKQAPASGAAADQFSSATSPSSVADTAAASKTPAPASDAAATHSSFTAGGPQRALPAVAAETHETGRALGFDRSDHSMFYFAEMLHAQARLKPGAVSPLLASVCNDIRQRVDLDYVYRDDAPVFLRAAE